MKEFIKKNKLIIIKLAVACILVICGTAFAKWDYFMYDKPVGKIISESTQCVNEGKGDMEPRYIQTLEIRLMNGPNKGKVITYYNKYLYSQFNTTAYEKGTDVFLSIRDENTKITKVKLDYYYAFIIGLFVAILILISGKRGVMILLSVVFNILIFYMGLKGFIDGRYIGLVTFALTIVFILITLLVLNGFSRKSFGAILSSLLTIGVVYLIYIIAMNICEKPMFELMDYIIGNEPLEKLYGASVVLGALGAIMDVAITVNSSVSEIVATSNQLELKSIIRSVREIGYDIMGTMVNVLFFTFICGGIPMFLLRIENGYALGTIMNLNIVFDEIRFLIGAIGIVLAIPLSGVVAVMMHFAVIKNQQDR